MSINKLIVQGDFARVLRILSSPPGFWSSLFRQNVVKRRDYNGQTPLHAATGVELPIDLVLMRWNRDPAIESLKRIADLLLVRGADIEARDREGRTPLHVAARRDNVGVCTSMAEHFVSRRANVNARDNEGCTPLHLAAEMGVVASVKLLLSHEVDPSAKDNSGVTPLHRAEKVIVIESLVAGKADVNAKDRHGNTPLHYASWLGNRERISVLIQHGADINVRNALGEPALESASNREEVAS